MANRDPRQNEFSGDLELPRDMLVMLHGFRSFRSSFSTTNLLNSYRFPEGFTRTDEDRAVSKKVWDMNGEKKTVENKCNFHIWPGLSDRHTILVTSVRAC